MDIHYSLCHVVMTYEGVVLSLRLKSYEPDIPQRKGSVATVI